MADILLRMLLWVSLGLAAVLLLRRLARGLFGASPAFTLWLLPLVLLLAPLLPQRLLPATVVALPGLAVTPQLTGVAHASTGIDWPQALVAIWLVGAAIGLLRLALHYAHLLSRARRATATWMASVHAAATASDLRRVRVHPAGPGVLFALPRPLLLLPEDFAQRFNDAASRELVLRHELTHLRRGDAWWTLVMEVVAALLWFHPLAWLARPRFRLDQELACDETSVRGLLQRCANYARVLLDSVAVQATPALIPWLAEPQLKERIAMLSRIQPSALRRGGGFLAITTLLAGGLLIAAGQAAIAAQPTPHAAPASAAPTVDHAFKQQHLPAYPATAVKAGEQGQVMLDVTVDASGNVKGVAVDPRYTTAPAALQTAVMAAATNWKFAAGTKDGKPVGGVVRVPVKFALQDAH